MGMLCRSAIMDASDLTRARVPCPEWGDQDSYVCVRVLTEAEREVFDRAVLATRDAIEGAEQERPLTSWQITLIRIAVCDDLGQPLFTEADDAWLMTKSQVVLQRLFRAIWDINEMAPEAQEAAKKNWQAMPENNSGTDWPGPLDAVSASAS